MGILILGIILLFIAWALVRAKSIAERKAGRSGEASADRHDESFSAVTLGASLMITLGALLTLIPGFVLIAVLISTPGLKEELSAKHDLIMMKLETVECANSKCLLDEVYAYNRDIMQSTADSENIWVKGLYSDFSDLELIDYSMVTEEHHIKHVNN